MIKEQVAEAYAKIAYARAPLQSQQDAEYIQGVSTFSHIAGWEACEAQCPGDAVAFLEWIVKNDYYVDYNGRCYQLKKKSVSYSIEGLYKLFNPSAAPAKSLSDYARKPGPSYETQEEADFAAGEQQRELAQYVQPGTAKTIPAAGFTHEQVEAILQEMEDKFGWDINAHIVDFFKEHYPKPTAADAKK